MKLTHITILGIAAIMLAWALNGMLKKPAGLDAVAVTLGTPSATPIEASATPIEASGIAILDAAGAAIASIEPGSPTRIAFAQGGKAFQSSVKENGKRKYKLADGSTAFQIKEKDQGFKLRDAGDKLLWKVKLGDSGKIKVSDNEESDRPIVLKTHSRSVSVEDDGKKLGEVRFDRAAGETRVTDADGALKYVIKSAKTSPGFGLLLSARVPKEAAAVLVAELLIRGR